MRDIFERAAAIAADNPDITSIWFVYEDVPMEELKAASGSLYLDSTHTKVVMQISTQLVTCFAYSKTMAPEMTICVCGRGLVKMAGEVWDAETKKMNCMVCK